jgi:hypothetical protein
LKRWQIVVLSILVLLGGAAGWAWWKVKQATPQMREKVVAYLDDKFDSNVKLDDLKVRFVPNLHVIGRGLELEWKRRQDIPPIVKIGEFRFRVEWLDLIQPIQHIARVDLKDFELNLPPKPPPDPSLKPGEDPPKPPKPKEEGHSAAASVVVDMIVADKMKLRLVPRDPEKPLKEFDLHELRILGAGLGQPLSYKTKMTNYKPPGIIDSIGQFGPWNRDEPGETPLAGTYTFDNADLGVFKGIGGIMTSKGKFGGVLHRIECDGEANVPEFYLTMANQKMPLKTKFHAIVDGTNGNTYLRPVEAVLGQTPFKVSGDIAGVKNVKGKTIDLDVDMPRGRIQDLIRLAVKGTPAMTGAVRMKSIISIPRGDEHVIDKLGLRGTVVLGSLKFTNAEIQSKVDALSRRAQGKPQEDGIQQVRSNLGGAFVLQDAILRFNRLQYAVEGAEIDLAGFYGLKSEEIDFQGTIALDAKASEAMGGFKGILLKPFDGLVSRKNKGTVLSLKIEGTREKPKFGVDFGRTLKKADKKDKKS